MKRTRSLILIVTGLLFLAGCTETAVQPVTETIGDESLTTDATNLTLIGETGRPQLLNAYASW